MILVNRFKSKMAAKYLDFDRFYNDSGGDYVLKVHICPTMTEQYKLTICVGLMWWFTSNQFVAIIGALTYFLGIW